MLNRKREAELVEKVSVKLRSFTARQMIRGMIDDHQWGFFGLTDKEWLRVVGRACRIVEAEL